MFHAGALEPWTEELQTSEPAVGASLEVSNPTLSAKLFILKELRGLRNPISAPISSLE